MNNKNKRSFTTFLILGIVIGIGIGFYLSFKTEYRFGYQKGLADATPEPIKLARQIYNEHHYNLTNYNCTNYAKDYLAILRQNGYIGTTIDIYNNSNAHRVVCVAIDPTNNGTFLQDYTYKEMNTPCGCMLDNPL